MTSLELRKLIRDKYAWPGGYPMYGVTSDGGVLCMDCMRKEYRQIAYARRYDLRDGWKVVGVDINYDDLRLHCDHCYENIEPAYDEEGECQCQSL